MGGVWQERRPKTKKQKKPRDFCADFAAALPKRFVCLPCFFAVKSIPPPPESFNFVSPALPSRNPLAQPALCYLAGVEEGDETTAFSAVWDWCNAVKAHK